MKKTSLCLAAVMAVLALSACSDTTKNDNLFAKNDITTTSAQDINYDTANSVGEANKSSAENDDIIYKSDNVTVTRCEPLEIPNIVYNLWYIPTEEELFNKCEVIADVTINSLEEVGISYTYMGAEGIDYNTLATVSVNSIYYSDYENISQEFTVAIPNSSYSCDEDFPEVSIGKRCILFISSTNGIEDSLEICNYADYYLSGPAHIINIDGNECRANKLFSAYSRSSAPATKEQSVDLFAEEALIESNNLSYDNINDDSASSIIQYSMPLNDFEKTLIEKINEKK